MQVLVLNRNEGLIKVTDAPYDRAHDLMRYNIYMNTSSLVHDVYK